MTASGNDTQLLELPAGVTPGTWTIDPVHSEVGFTVRHLMTKVRGWFEEFDGALEVAANPADSSVAVTIQLASVDTRNGQRDEHLRSSDFFAIEQYPTITFASTGLRPTGETGFVLSGDLTIKGVTKSVELKAEYLGVADDPLGTTARVGFEASTTINRKDFGVDTNVPLGGDKMLIGDEVEVRLSVQAVQQA